MDDEADVRVIVVMGVSGAGKTTVGQALAQALGWEFFDGDDFHPQANIAKMSAGQPLDDADRAPWLDRLHDFIHARLMAREPAVLAASVLKRAYRDRLREDNHGLTFVYLHGDPQLIHRRLAARHRHYMAPGMLASQLADLEEPQKAIKADIARPVTEIVREIMQALGQGRLP